MKVLQGLTIEEGLIIFPNFLHPLVTCIYLVFVPNNTYQQS